MKKNKKTLVTVAIALALVSSFVLGASASSTLTKIQAYLNYGITIEYNGEAQELYDAQGVRLYPISYNNSTYVPIRAVSNILGVNVDWDQARQTVVLGTPTTGVDLLENYSAYSVHHPSYQSFFTVTKIADKKPQTIAGINVSHYLQIHSTQFGGGVFDAYYNISNGNYGTVSFQIYATKDMTLEVRGDNDTVLASIPVTGSQLPQSVTVPLAGSKQLGFVTKIPSYNSTDAYIFDVMLK